MLIIAGLFLSIICAYILLEDRKGSVAIAYGITLIGIWVYLVTEVLSMFNVMNRSFCIGTWILYDCFMAALVTWILIRKHIRLTMSVIGVLCKASKSELMGAVVLGLYALFIFSLAVRIVPYNWDSLSYHLSRIWFWTQNESVAHFTTMDTRMLGTPGFAEFIDMHLYLLYGQSNDAVLNLTQSFSYILNIIFVYSIARRIGVDDFGRIFAVLLFAASPIVFAESLSTQTDEFAALWILAFSRVVLEIAYSDDGLCLDKKGIGRLLVLAMSLALSILTKPSGLFCVASLFVWLLYRCLKRKDNVRLIVTWIVFVTVIMVAIIMPEAVRNIVTYGAITDPWQGPGQLVLTIDLRYQFINFFKNIGFFLPGVLWPSFNNIWQHLVYYLGYILHIDIDSSLISEGGNYQDNLLGKVENYEYDTATNSVITILFLGILLITVIRCIIYGVRKIVISDKKELSCTISFGYSLAAFLAFIITCAFVKSEVFVCRYMIASFGLLAPAICLQIQKLGKYKNRLFEGLIYGASGLLICAQLFNMIIVHLEHKYSGDDRAEAYYEVNGGEYGSVYEPLSRYLEENAQEYHSIGIKMDSNTYVYPVLRLLEEYSDIVYYIDVPNASSKYSDNDYQPDCIIVITYADMGDMYNEDYVYNGSSYVHDDQLSGRCRVFVR